MVLDPGTRLLNLLHQHDYRSAERLLAEMLQHEPADAPTRSLRALCLAELNRWDEATAEARRAVDTEPYLAFCHWALGMVLADRRRWSEAADAAREAMELEPENGDHYALLARSFVGMQRWDDALAAADQGLEEEPDHPGCSNLRALVLQQRGRMDEAEQAFVDAAATDPENAFARAGRGWTALRRGDAVEPARAHFEHALRIDPRNEWAAEGLMTSIKARNPLYRLMLRYFLWMDGLSRGARFGIMMAGLLGYNQARRLTEVRPETAPYLYPLMGLYLLFVLLTWVADPVFDFLLRFDPQGRRMVSREREIAGTVVVSLLSVAIVLAVIGLVRGGEDALFPALMVALLVLPIAGIFRCAPGWPRTALTFFVAAVAAAGLAGMVMTGPTAGLLSGVSLLGVLIGSWVAIGLSSVRPAR
ncbi:MAG TPA: tetratricopeptide repeat protein [Longimicrobium sp.]|nr:tetratricopeptide repeat protein [Longimicrobium sp.]